MKSNTVTFVTKYFGNARGGIGRYEEMLYRSLLDQITVTLSPIKAMTVPRWASSFARTTLNKDLIALMDNYPLLVSDKSPNSILHFTNQNMGLSLNLYPRLRKVITVHDIIPYLQLEEISPRRIIQNRSTTHILTSMTFRSLRKANRLIADSQNTKRDLVKHLSIEEKKIDVVYLGVDRTVYRPLDNLPSRRIYGIPPDSKVVFYAGSLEPYKNVKIVIEALSILKKNRLRVFLLISGRGANQNVNLLSLIENAGLKDRVIFTGFVPELELPILYNIADVFVMPSLYEGFGLPVLEAMSCGCPVISSNSSSLPEVVGAAGMLISPYEAKTWADALQEVLEDTTKAQIMSVAGLEQAAKFNWDVTAMATIATYMKLQ